MENKNYREMENIYDSFQKAHEKYETASPEDEPFKFKYQARKVFLKFFS